MPGNGAPEGRGEGTHRPARDQAEQHGDQRRPDRLADETGARLHAAGAAAALPRGAGDDDLVVRRLEQSEADPRQRQAPDQVEGRGRLRQKGEGGHAGGQEDEADAAETSRWNAVGEPAGEGRHRRDGERPRRH
jgi:hypothetical protein